MTSLAAVSEAETFAKLFLVGDSKAGKTSALIGLVEAGYHLRIADMDCKINPSYLQQYIAKNCPERLGQIEYVQYRDEYENSPIDGTTPKRPVLAYDRLLKATTKWPDDDSRNCDLGPNYIWVLDTLNATSIAAFNQAWAMNPESKGGRSQDARQWYKSAQNAVEAYISGLWSDKFRCNVIIISHITDIELESHTDNKGNKIVDVVKGFPTTIGQALSKTIAKYTNEMYQAQRTGEGAAEKREILTRSNSRIDLGSAALDLPKSLPIQTGLVTIFEKLRGIK